jgi:hypothetical protein
MSSMVVGGCKSANIVHLRGGYWKPIAIIVPIFLSQRWPLCYAKQGSF